jgi:hypothetical protein
MSLNVLDESREINDGMLRQTGADGLAALRAIGR